MILSSELDYVGNKIVGLIDRELKIVEKPVKPYFFITENDVWNAKKKAKVVYEKDLRGMKGERVFRVICDEPHEVKELKKKLKGVKFEADVHYLRRLLVDKVFDIEYNKVAYLDIEVDDSDLSKVTKFGDVRVLSIGLSIDGKDYWLHGDEKEMFEEFRNVMLKEGCAVIAGWNIEFDYKHLVNRSKLFGEDLFFKVLSCIDLLEEYKATVKGLSDYKLENVCRFEGLGEKKRDKRVCEMSEKELEEYNMNDVWFVEELDKKYGFVELKTELAEIVNLCISMLTSAQIADTLLLRRARKLGYVLEDRKFERKKGYEGAYVHQPVTGLHRCVAEYDFESLYPSVIVNEKIDVEGFNGALLPVVVAELMELRREYKQKFKETGEKKYDVLQNAYKILVNSLYGVFGLEGFRFFDESKAGFITAKARELILKVIEFTEKKGYKVLYADTDSCFVKLKSVDEAEMFEKAINEVVKPYKMKLDAVFDVVIFTDVKKRYWGWTVDGEEIVRGFELRRSDWFELMKETQKIVVEMLKEGRSKDDIVAELSKIKREMKTGKLDEKLIICKTVRSPDSYKVDAPHVRAFKKALERGYRSVDGRIRYVYVNGDVEPVLDIDELRGKLDYEWYWKLIRGGVIDRLLSAVFVKQKKLEGGEFG